MIKSSDQKRCIQYNLYLRPIFQWDRNHPLYSTIYHLISTRPDWETKTSQYDGPDLWRESELLFWKVDQMHCDDLYGQGDITCICYRQYQVCKTPVESPLLANKALKRCGWGQSKHWKTSCDRYWLQIGVYGPERRARTTRRHEGKKGIRRQ